MNRCCLLIKVLQISSVFPGFLWMPLGSSEPASGWKGVKAALATPGAVGKRAIWGDLGQVGSPGKPRLPCSAP